MRHLYRNRKQGIHYAPNGMNLLRSRFLVNSNAMRVLRYLSSCHIHGSTKTAMLLALWPTGNWFTYKTNRGYNSYLFGLLVKNGYVTHKRTRKTTKWYITQKGKNLFDLVSSPRFVTGIPYFRSHVD